MKKIIVISSIVIILLLMSNTKAFAKITKENKDRGCDPLGCGSFGSKRTHGMHKGIDKRAVPGETIFSPITGIVNRYPDPYANDSRYSGIEIENSTYKIKMFYLKANVAVGSTVIAGQPIGIAQNISAKHGAAMRNHVHFEAYKNGVLIDPTNMFK